MSTTTPNFIFNSNVLDDGTNIVNPNQLLSTYIQNISTGGGTSSIATAITITSSLLPSGASTSSLQISKLAVLTQIHSDLTNNLSITATTLPLPNGASTNALQITGNTLLSQLHADLIASLPSGTNTIGGVNVTATTLPLPTGASTSNLQISGNTLLSQLHNDLIAPLPSGTNTIGTVNISAATLPLPSGAAQESGGNLATIVTNTNNIPLKGSAAMSGSTPVVLANKTFTSGATAATSGNNILTTDNSPTDCISYQSGVIQITTSAGISAGIITFETSVDGTNFVVLQVSDLTVINANPVTTLTLAASVTRVFAFPILARYIRARISTGVAGGTVAGYTVLSQTEYNNLVLNLQQATAASLNVTAAVAAAQTLATVTTVGTVTTVSTVTASNSAIPGIIADVASAAIITTTTTATLTPTFGNSYVVSIPVTVVSGTLPTLDVEIQESDDTGTNWYAVYDFPRITTTGIYRSPKLSFNGNRIRYVQTVAGTTPSFTRAINRLQASDSQAPIRQLIDRTVSLTTLNATTPSLNIQNCRNVQLVINIGTATGAPTLQLQGSDDNGGTWYSVGSTLLAVASSTVQLTINNVNSQLIRGLIQSAGNTVVAGYVLIKAF